MHVRCAFTFLCAKGLKSALKTGGGGGGGGGEGGDVHITGWRIKI